MNSANELHESDHELEMHATPGATNKGTCWGWKNGPAGTKGARCSLGMPI